MAYVDANRLIKLRQISVTKRKRSMFEKLDGKLICLIESVWASNKCMLDHLNKII